MSSPAAATPTPNPSATDTAAGGGAEQHTTPSAASDGGGSPQSPTFWCHECDMRVAILLLDSSAPPPLICPHCRGEFLEETAAIPGSPSESDSVSVSDDISFSSIDSSLVFSPSSDAHTGGDSPISARAPSPAAASAIDSLPAVHVSDPSLLCAVCKDDFAPDPCSDAVQLPCAHVYHRDCIVPWLSRRNSCPLCRSRIHTADRNPRPTRRPRLSSSSSSGSENDSGESLGMTASTAAMIRNIAMQSMRSFLARMAAERTAQDEMSSLRPASETQEAVRPARPGEGGSGFGGGTRQLLVDSDDENNADV